MKIYDKCTISVGLLQSLGTIW